MFIATTLIVRDFSSLPGPGLPATDWTADSVIAPPPNAPCVDLFVFRSNTRFSRSRIRNSGWVPFYRRIETFNCA